MELIPPDLLAKILNFALRPAAWPWSPEVRSVCRFWLEIAESRQERMWFLEFSSLAPTKDVPLVSDDLALL